MNSKDFCLSFRCTKPTHPGCVKDVSLTQVQFPPGTLTCPQQRGGAEAEQGELAAPAAPGAEEVAAVDALSCWPMARATPGAAETFQKSAPGADTGTAL